MTTNEPPRGPREPSAPCSDGAWLRRCAPLLDYLATPRTWDELTAWASSRGMSGSRLRNQLAWLEGERVAGSFADKRTDGHPTLWRRYAPAS